MRVIAGNRRRYRLFTPKGDRIRPTSDKIKETLFNMINDRVYDSVFLDLFAGTGQIGIEALSREARQAVFIDGDRTAISLIRKNIEHTGLSEVSQVIQGPLPGALRSADRYAPDIIFMDPPYDLGLYRPVFSGIAEMKSVDEDTLIIAEADINEDFSFLDEIGFSVEREKCYKTSKHVFVKRKYE